MDASYVLMTGGLGSWGSHILEKRKNVYMLGPIPAVLLQSREELGDLMMPRISKPFLKCQLFVEQIQQSSPVGALQHSKNFPLRIESLSFGTLSARLPLLRLLSVRDCSDERWRKGNPFVPVERGHLIPPPSCSDCLNRDASVRLGSFHSVVRPQNAAIQVHFSNHGRRLEEFPHTMQASRLEEGCGTYRTKPEKGPCSP
jgi:hypothetical protein